MTDRHLDYSAIATVVFSQLTVIGKYRFITRNLIDCSTMMKGNTVRSIVFIQSFLNQTGMTAI
jgi:hypothetical protein